MHGLFARLRECHLFKFCLKLGRICTQSSVCIFWSWDSYRLNCDLKESDGQDGAIIAEDYISGDSGCPPSK